MPKNQNQMSPERLDFFGEFLLRFTKEVIENTATYQKAKTKEDVHELIKKEHEDRIVSEQLRLKAAMAREDQKKAVFTAIHQKMKKDTQILDQGYIKGLPLEMEELSTPPRINVFQERRRVLKPILQIPETPLPPTVQHLKPEATEEVISLGRLDSCMSDPKIRIIECNGPGEEIYVSGSMGRKPTAIKLSEEEIEEILGKFSTASKIPVNEGLFKAAIGNAVISAVVSDIVGIKFVIRKI